MPASEEAALGHIIRRVCVRRAREIVSASTIDQSVAEAKQAVSDVQESLAGSTIPKDDGTPLASRTSSIEAEMHH